MQLQNQATRLSKTKIHGEAMFRIPDSESQVLAPCNIQAKDTGSLSLLEALHSVFSVNGNYYQISVPSDLGPESTHSL